MRKKAEVVEWNRRLRAVKLRWVLFSKKCQCCGDFISREKIYVVPQWDRKRTVENYYYCQECVHSKEEVLKTIYKNGSRGIAYIDPYSCVPQAPPKLPQLEELY